MGLEPIGFGVGSLPWEAGPLAFITGEHDDLFMQSFSDFEEAARAAMPPVPVIRTQESHGHHIDIVQGDEHTCKRPRGRRTQGIAPRAQDERFKEGAVEKWQLLLIKAGEATELWHQCSGNADALRKAIGQCLELKAASTAQKRAGAVLLYVQWASQSGKAPFPLREATVNAYLEHASFAAPTRGASFLEALAFAKGLFNLKGVDDVFTARNRGLATRGIQKKRRRVQRTPMTCAALELCEAEIAKGLEATSLTDQEFVILGLLLFRVHARLRCGDATRITLEPKIDGEYFETELAADQHKTGHAHAFKDLVLPVAGFADGVLGAPWCAEWLGARAALGLNAEIDGTLMPAALADGSFGLARMTTSEVGLWEKAILTKLGLHDLVTASFGTRSAKAILLSWAAKADLPSHHRKLLGAHVDKEEKSMLTYARDALAGPLRHLQKVFIAVHERKFLPDASRSGRWVDEKASQPASSQEKGEESSADSEAEPTSVVDSSSEAKSSGTSAPSDDEEVEENKEVEQTAVAIAEHTPEVNKTRQMPPAGIVRHMRYRTIHIRGGVDGEFKTACGLTLLPDDYEKMSDWPPAAWPLCKRARCFGSV